MRPTHKVQFTDELVLTDEANNNEDTGRDPMFPRMPLSRAWASCKWLPAYVGRPVGRTVATLLSGDLKLFMHGCGGLDRVLASLSFVAHAPSAPPRASCFQHGGRDFGAVSSQHRFAEPAFLLHRRGSVSADSPRASCRTNPGTDWRDEQSGATSDQQQGEEAFQITSLERNPQRIAEHTRDSLDPQTTVDALQIEHSKL